MPLPVVAIVGRPNVGKSTLFNRIVGERKAIVADEPGTTRDRLIARTTWAGRDFLLVDTGGLLLGDTAPLAEQVRAQVLQAVQEADVLLFLTDVRDGLTPADADVADLLRRSGKPVVLAVNKADSERHDEAVHEFHRLGLGEPVPISAIHNRGIYDLMDRVVALLPPVEPEPAPEGVMRLAIVGRPNVGKSSLLNAIAGEERAIVSETPGTTRDAVDILVRWGDRPVLLVDTAGIRRPGRRQPGVEKFSALRALQAIERCDVALLVMDATEPATAQDLHIGGYVTEAYKGLVLVVNKWDLARQMGMDQAEVFQYVRARFHWCPYAPIRFTCALTGEGVPETMEVALQVYQERLKEIPQRDLNRVLTTALGNHPPPSRGRRYLRIYRLTQEGVNPPTFVFWVNDPDLVHFSYQRYLENVLRAHFGFLGNHLRLVFRKRPGRRGRRE